MRHKICFARGATRKSCIKNKLRAKKTTKFKTVEEIFKLFFVAEVKFLAIFPEVYGVEPLALFSSISKKLLVAPYFDQIRNL